MNRTSLSVAALIILTGCGPAEAPTAPSTSEASEAGWVVDFFDDFDRFEPENWQDQILWVNNEDQCYVRDGAHGTREISEGTLKLRVVDLGEPVACDNLSKHGEQHPDTPYVAGRLASKNRQEFVQGRWTARLRVPDSGQDGMFPAWWLLGAQNNEPPVEESDETVCWPLTGSGEIDIFEHHSDTGVSSFIARIIDSEGECDRGDWETYESRHFDYDIGEFHDYSVEWQGESLIFRIDGDEIYRIEDQGADFPEPLFAILNFAKINDAPMTSTWEMEVDWVRHESWRETE